MWHIAGQQCPMAQTMQTGYNNRTSKICSVVSLVCSVACCQRAVNSKEEARRHIGIHGHIVWYCHGDGNIIRLLLRQ